MATIRTAIGGLRRDVLGACIALAIVPAGTHADAARPAGTWTVENCDDDGPGSLREALSMAADHDSVDLATLACSTITLTTGQLTVGVDNIALTGNGVTIDGARSQRVLHHTGTGTLSATGIVFANGYAADASGGCVNSSGSVAMDHVTVRGCLAIGPISIQGGGVYAIGDIEIRYTTVTGNTAATVNGGPYDGAGGGGLVARGAVTIFESTISDNSAVSNTIYATAGGFASSRGTTIDHSTISGNHANRAGAMDIEGWPPGPQGSSITDSTISGNTADSNAAGIMCSDNLSIRNSSIVFNATANGFCAAGLLMFGDVLTIDGSIVAKNTAIGGLADDICMQGRDGLIAYGANNIVIAAFGDLPPDTIRTDPMLAPLADNGGPTLTHALLPGSPAIDHGSNILQLATDQRGLVRSVGAGVDIGAFEVQPPEQIFANGFDPSG